MGFFHCLRTQGVPILDCECAIKALKRKAFCPHWSCERSEATHEMAKDEASHGKAFEGLLKRYFK